MGLVPNTDGLVSNQGYGLTQYRAGVVNRYMHAYILCLWMIAFQPFKNKFPSDDSY